MHIHVYAHKLYLPRSFVCIHGRGYRVHTCVYQAYATEVFMYCYWNLVHRIPAVVKVGTVSSLAAPGAVVMTVSCATGAALSTYSNRRTPRSCGRYFKTSYPVSCMYVRDFIMILLNTSYYICIYVSWWFLAKFYDMCIPEILCHFLQYRTRISSPKMRAFASHASACDANALASHANARIRIVCARIASARIVCARIVCECAHVRA